jgi:gas vesicle protein
MMTDQKNTTGFLFGTLIGFSLGVVTALLLARKSGKELRGDIADQYQKVSDGTQEWARQAGDKTSELVERAKQIGSNVRNEVSAAVENFREAVSTAGPSDADKKPSTERDHDIK